MCLRAVIRVLDLVDTIKSFPRCTPVLLFGGVHGLHCCHPVQVHPVSPGWGSLRRPGDSPREASRDLGCPCQPVFCWGQSGLHPGGREGGSDLLSISEIQGLGC